MITELFAVEVNLIEERTSATSKCPQLKGVSVHLRQKGG